MALFALCHIGQTEELTYDYNFSLFNPHEGQKCRCGSKDCRGVIGGKTQRINVKTVGGIKTAAEKVSEKGQRNRDRKKAVVTSGSRRANNNDIRINLMAPIKVMTQAQRTFAKEHGCFLLRNLEKVRKFRETMAKKVEILAGREEEKASSVPVNTPEEMIMTGLTALTTARSMQTRRLTIAQDDPKVTKVVKLAQILREIFSQVTTVNGNYSMFLNFSSVAELRRNSQFF
jgi:histone-lysine N-methyltransferase ASH1L